MYFRSSLTRYLGTDHLVFVGGRGGGGLGTYQIKVLRKKFKRKKSYTRKYHDKKIQACVLVEYFYMNREKIENRSGESGADVYNHPPNVAQINLQ